MPDFYNLDDLVNYIDTKIAPDVAKEILMVEARKLRDLILQNIQAWYDSYTPSVYQRTDLWYEALQIGDFVPLPDGSYEINLYFDNNPSEHPSLWNQEDGYVPYLMDVGWHIKWNRPERIPMLSDFNGSHYLEDALREYNASNPYGLRAIGDYNGVVIGGL